VFGPLLRRHTQGVSAGVLLGVGFSLWLCQDMHEYPEAALACLLFSGPALVCSTTKHSTINPFLTMRAFHAYSTLLHNNVLSSLRLKHIKPQALPMRTVN
jgi:hypothetical protein